MDVSARTRQRKVKSRRRTATQIGHERHINNAAQLSVTLSIPQHVREKLSREWIVRVSTKAFLLHILHSRGVCPAPAVETLRKDDGTRRTNTIERKFSKFGGSLERLLEDWTLLCISVHVERVLITLGPSWSRQREHHILDFSRLGKDDMVATTDPGAGQEHALSRRLTRALLDGIMDEEGTDDLKNLAHPSPSGSSYAALLSVWVTHQMADTLFTKSMNNVGIMSPFQQLLRSLILRPGYSTTRNATKRTQPHVVTARISSFEVDKGDCDWKEENGIWVSLPTALKGFRI